ncbi:MAG TPA: YceI family protein [Verrucomicrobiae bacterium]|jgi:polyisoprenoid-binding protein YceI
MKTSLLALAPLVVLLGCSKNPAENVPAADVRTATNAAALPPAAAKSYAFGPTDSKIEFVGSKVTGKHDGGFNKFTGELNIVDGKLAGAGNKVVIDMTSTFSDTDRLTGHLKSADFFDVAKFPTATFVTTAIEPGATNSIVTGNLTLHGVTKQISFPARIEVSDAAVKVNAEFFLNRIDFDIKYPGKAEDLIRQEVVLRLKVDAKPGKAEFPVG